MTIWRELYTTAISNWEDLNSISVPELVVTNFCELILNIALIRTRSVIKDETISFPADSFFPSISYLPVVNIHTLLPDVTLIMAARDGYQKRLSRVGFNITTAFEDLWLGESEITSFYTVGATLLGIQPMPEFQQEVTISYIPYHEVNSLDETIPLSDDYRLPLEALLLSLLFARLGHFERALAKLTEGQRMLGNVQRRQLRT